ncbi:MAG TPA: hypothetical protein VFZ53_13600, partial [Polyangiaceae bacterium]
RREQAERNAQEAARTRDALRAAVQRRSLEIAAKQSEVLTTTAPDPAAQVELVGLLGSMDTLERDLEAANRRASSFQLGAALEQGGVGLRVEVVDDATLPNEARRTRWIIVAAGASFLFGLPLSAMAVGAFFPRRPA